MVKYNWCHR